MSGKLSNKEFRMRAAEEKAALVSRQLDDMRHELFLKDELIRSLRYSRDQHNNDANKHFVQNVKAKRALDKAEYQVFVFVSFIWIVAIPLISLAIMR